MYSICIVFFYTNVPYNASSLMFLFFVLKWKIVCINLFIFFFRYVFVQIIRQKSLEERRTTFKGKISTGTPKKFIFVPKYNIA